MGKQVQVNSGFSRVWLYPGGVFDGGATVTLTDAEYTALGTAGQSRVTVLNGSVADPARDTTSPLVRSSNLADLPDKSAARTSLGLGSAATHATSDYATAAQGALAAMAIQPTAFVPYVPSLSMYGPATTDITSVTPGAAADGTFNESYAIASNALPAIWPETVWGAMSVASNTYAGKTSQSGIASSVTHRFMCDGSDFCVMMNGATFSADIFIDKRPYASNPVALANTSGYGAYGFLTLVFPSAKPRLIEIRSTAGVVAIYAKKPYRVWKPAPDPNPSVAVVGDSYVAPTVMNDAASGNVANGFYDLGLYQRMHAHLGITSFATDGIGGTGYLAGGGANMPYTHSARIAWLQGLNPDVIVVHGGGANDLYNSNTVAATITAAVNHFTNLRSLFPNAKLVFVEGIAPPGFTPATYNPNYVAVRQGVQSGLASAGVGAYFLDVATTRPPISGSGYVTAANSTGNSDIYIGSDTFHPTIKGNQYLRHVLSPKLARVLADDGSLVGSLVL